MGGRPHSRPSWGHEFPLRRVIIKQVGDGANAAERPSVAPLSIILHTSVAMTAAVFVSPNGCWCKVMHWPVYWRADTRAQRRRRLGTVINVLPWTSP